MIIMIMLLLVIIIMFYTVFFVMIFIMIFMITIVTARPDHEQVLLPSLRSLRWKFD